MNTNLLSTFKSNHWKDCEIFPLLFISKYLGIRGGKFMGHLKSIEFIVIYCYSYNYNNNMKLIYNSSIYYHLAAHSVDYC